MALTLVVMLSGLAWLALAVRLYFADEYSMKEKLDALGSASLRAVLVLDEVCTIKRVKNWGKFFLTRANPKRNNIPALAARQHQRHPLSPKHRPPRPVSPSASGRAASATQFINHRQFAHLVFIDR